MPKSKRKVQKKANKNNKTKKKEFVLSDKQAEIIIKKFYEHSQAKIIEMVFENSKSLVEEMLDFIVQKIVNDFKPPISDNDFEKGVIEIISANAKEMSQDLIFNQVNTVIVQKDAAAISDCSLCNKKCKSTTSDFNSVRGL